MRKTLFIAMLSLCLNACGEDNTSLATADLAGDVGSESAELNPAQSIGAYENGVLFKSAIFDARYEVPGCAEVGSNCDSGSLLNGRSESAPEVNSPNTLNASCADGTLGSYWANRAIERLTVSTTDGTNLAAGKTVKLEATVYASSLVQDKLDLYYTASVDNPSWTYLGTYSPSRSGLNTISVTYTLPEGGVQAVRANFRFVDSTDTHSAPSICSSGRVDDHDDLLFTVQPASAFH